MALPRQHRLRDRRLFDRLYRQGRRLHGRYLTLRLLEADSLPQAESPPTAGGGPAAAAAWRCGVVVSSKVNKRAVVRNRLRRRIHAHLLTQRLPMDRPLWILINLRPESDEAPLSDLLGECSHLLRKAGLIHERSEGA